MDKKEIRNMSLNKRASLKNKNALDALIAKQAMHLAEGYETIAIFHSFKDEIHTLGIIEILLRENKRVACPKITEGIMRFIQVKSIDDFEKGYFGIFEPKGELEIKPEEFDLIFVPLLAYNDAFYRVGYGGGFYDRYLPYTNAFKVGLAYRCLKTELNFQNDFDVKLDAILTEKGFI